MPVQLIAVDMDGTFLNAEKRYNKSRFLRQYAELKQRGIHFVAASGNPSYTLKAYFPEIADEIAFVAENGAHVVDAGVTLNYDYFDPKLVKEMVEDLAPQHVQGLILCAKDTAYISHAVTPKTKEKLNIYFKELKVVQDLSQIEDDICKLTLTTLSQDISELSKELEHKTYIQQNQVKMVSSGFGFIDLIIPNKHKAYGLNFLQKKWGIHSQNILAIGDNYNDIEMIEMAGFGIAMQNAVPKLRQIARYIAPDNEHEGVLDIIDLVLNGEPLPEKTAQNNLVHGS